MVMAEEQYKELNKNLTRILDMSLKEESIDIRKDVRILTRAFPFKVSTNLGGTLYNSESLNISDDGKVTIESETGESLNLIPSTSSYIKHCRFT